MPYELRKYDGTVLLTLADGLTEEASSSLTFVGRNVSNFGKIQNENYLHLLENFAGTTQPSNMLAGQIWYDSYNHILKLNNSGDRLYGVAVLDYTDTKPGSGHQGYLWWDSSNKQLFISTGSDYTLVGPERIEGYGVTRFVSSEVLDSLNTAHPVIKLTIDDEVLGIISRSEFTVNYQTTITGISKVYRGITLKDSETTDVQLYGRSVNSNYSVTATNILSGLSGSVPYQTAPGLTSFVNIGPANSVLYSNGTTPSWISFATLSNDVSTTATNISGGSQGAIPYQTSAGKTTFLPLSTEGFVLTAGATKPKWMAVSGVAAGTAVTATNSNSLLGDDEITYRYASTSTLANTIVQRTDDADIYANKFRGVAVQAQYADLAEKYLPDADYEIGTVVVIGGEQEITSSTWGQRALGVISANPAYVMNSDLENGVYVALKGRVPVKVIGSVKKGDRLIASNNGCAVAGVPHSSDVFAIAIETNTDVGVKFVESVVL